MTDDARYRHDAASRAALASALEAYRPVEVEDPALRPAAVSVVLIPGRRGETRVILTRRAPRLRAHSGQYALPGGRVDPGETAVQAALRELEEELGIAARRDAILGRLDDLPTRAGYLIRPFVLWLGEAPAIRPAPAEIAEVFHLPITDLFAGRGRGGNREDAVGAEAEPGVFSLFIPTLGHDLFAPTAAILEHFRAVAVERAPRPVIRFGEPAFARR